MHIAYHALVALYFIWFVVFAVLQIMALNNYYGGANPQLNKILLAWILLNLFMGTALLIVIQKFGRRLLLSRVVFYSYFFMAASSVTTVFIIL